MNMRNKQKTNTNLHLLEAVAEEEEEAEDLLQQEEEGEEADLQRP